MNKNIRNLLVLIFSTVALVLVVMVAFAKPGLKQAAESTQTIKKEKRKLIKPGMHEKRQKRDEKQKKEKEKK